MNFIKGHLLAFLTITIWSSTFIISKVLLEQFEPTQILIFRFIICILFLTIIYPKFTFINHWKEEIVVVSGATCIAFYFIFENSALKYTYASNVSLIVATIPILTILISNIQNKKKIRSKKIIIGFIIAYSGVVLLILNGGNLQGVDPKGDFLALGAAISFSIYSIVLDRVHNKYHIIQLTRKVFIYALALFLIINFIKGQSLPFRTLSPNIAFALLYLGIFASSLAFLMWNLAIKTIGSIKTNQYIYFVPIVTTIFSAIVLDEKITMTSIVGTLLIIGGVYFTENTFSFRKKSKYNVE